MRRLTTYVFGAAAVLSVNIANAADITLLNVSYDPTRELYKAINGAFAAQWKAKTGDNLTINMRVTAARASRPARSSMVWTPTS